MKENRELIKQEIAAIYDESALRYHTQHYVSPRSYSPLQYRQHYIEGMIQSQSIPTGSKILDVGCGPGELIVNLLRKGYDVWGVDISQGMIHEAIRTIRGNGFPEWNQGSVGDIEKLPFSDGFFDVVVASGVIEYQKDDEAALVEMNRLLKKGGFLIANVTNKYAYLRLLDSMRERLGLGKKTHAVGIPDKRMHAPKVFDQEIAAFGFEKTSHNYFHFCLLPKPLDSIFRFINEPVAKKMEALTNSRFGMLGGGYLVIARKIRNIG